MEGNSTQQPLGKDGEDHSTHYTESLETCIRHRHSIRFFKPDPVPMDLFHDCLALASLAPSNSNIQNWRITFASGAARDRIITTLSTEAAKGPPQIPPLPESFRHYRSELGHRLYGEEGYGIPRSDHAGSAAATARNFRFFDAPVVAVIHMDKDLSPADSMSVGMYVQTLLLALTERGLGACLMISVIGYPEVLREGFKLPDDELIICGMALGWPEKGNKVNDLIITREEIDRAMVFLTD